MEIYARMSREQLNIQILKWLKEISDFKCFSFILCLKKHKNFIDV